MSDLFERIRTGLLRQGLMQQTLMPVAQTYEEIA